MWRLRPEKVKLFEPGAVLGDDLGLLKVIRSVLYPPGNIWQPVPQTTDCVARAFVAVLFSLGDTGMN